MLKQTAILTGTAAAAAIAVLGAAALMGLSHDEQVPEHVLQLARGGDTVAVFVMDPRDIFVCGQAVAEWLSWGRAGHSRDVRIVLTRAPELREAVAIRANRLPVDTSTTLPASARRTAPRLFLVHHTASMGEAVGAPQMIALLSTLERAGPQTD